jgi:hypothetical protein
VNTKAIHPNGNDAGKKRHVLNRISMTPPYLRSTVARETPTAAQTAAIMPLTGVNATTALVKARCHPAPSGSPADRQVFLDDNDGFRTGKAPREMGVILL